MLTFFLRLAEPDRIFALTASVVSAYIESVLELPLSISQHFSAEPTCRADQARAYSDQLVPSAVCRPPVERGQMLTFFLLLAEPERILALTASVVSAYIESALELRRSISQHFSAEPISSAEPIVSADQMHALKPPSVARQTDGSQGDTPYSFFAAPMAGLLRARRQMGRDAAKWLFLLMAQLRLLAVR